MPTFLNEGIYAFEFLTGEQSELSIDNIVLANGQNLVAGAVIAKNFVGTGAFAMAAGSTGNPTCGAVTVLGKALAGTYTCLFTDATHFQVFNPAGAYLGNGVLGTAFLASGKIGFTLTAGVTPAIAGDEADILVTEGASVYVAATGSDASAILGPATNATGGATATLAVTRLAQYKTALVNFGAMDAGHIAAAKAALTRNNIIGRGGN